jgi:hypothetical protein
LESARSIAVTTGASARVAHAACTMAVTKSGDHLSPDHFHLIHLIPDAPEMPNTGVGHQVKNNQVVT